MTSTLEVTGTANGEVFKTDTVGRVRVSRARREALLDEFERSGGSGAQFAAYVGVKYSTFASWVNKRRQRQGVGPPRGPSKPNVPEPIRWWETVVEADAPGASGTGVLQVHLPGGAQVELSNASQAGLMAVLLDKLERFGTKKC